MRTFFQRGPQQLVLPLPRQRRRRRDVRRIAQNRLGVGWMLLAAAFYALVLVFAKAAGERLHATEILLFRSLVMIACTLPVLLTKFPSVIKTSQPGLHAARVTCSFFSMLFAFIAVINLPLADATTLSFSKSFFIILFGLIILGEMTNARRMAAVCVGFVGIAIVLRPSGDDSVNVYGLLAVAAAASSGLADVFVRRISQTDSAVTLMVYQAIGLGLLMLPPALWFWKTPNDVEFVLLLSLGLCAAAAQYCNTQAFRVGEISVVSTLDYSRLLYVFVLTAIFFPHWPSTSLIVGAIIIITAGIYVIQSKNTCSARNTRDGFVWLPKSNSG